MNRRSKSTMQGWTKSGKKAYTHVSGVRVKYDPNRYTWDIIGGREDGSSRSRLWIAMMAAAKTPAKWANPRRRNGNVISADVRVVAKWNTKGNDFLILFHDRYGYSYRGHGQGGSLGSVSSDAAAIAQMEAGPVKYLKMDRPSLHRVKNPRRKRRFRSRRRNVGGHKRASRRLKASRKHSRKRR